MKQILIVALCIMFTSNVLAQAGNFNGKWANKETTTTADEHTSGIMEIADEHTTWNIFNNHLFFDFTNKMKGDTLLLIYKSCDCSNPYRKSTIKFPKTGSIVAKCYLLPNNELGVTYVAKKLVSSVMDYVHMSMSNTEKKAIFPDKLYRVEDK